MDQDSFRKLLHSDASGASASHTASSLGVKGVHKPKKTSAKAGDAAQPAFKPRAVKKNDDRYRDRAAERRQGVAHDYAQVEALAEDFEKRNKELDKETVEEQRRYLGGDSEHTVLVRGLDYALLEQNKARQADSTEDDDTLEQAFIQGSSNAPKKRTREDIVKELKNKRQKGDSDEAAASVPTGSAPIDEAKKAGKFKPIGFKPIGAAEGKKMKKKVKEGEKEGVKKMKKKKVTSTDVASTSAPDNNPEETPSAPVPTSQTAKPPPKPEPEPMDEDDDIFAGAGEYAGIEVGDDEDDDSEPEKKGQDEGHEASDGEIPEAPRGRWVDVDGPTPAPRKSSSPSRINLANSSRMSTSPQLVPAQVEEGEEEEGAISVRLQPLASSTVPSIRDLLAMDEEVEKAEKRKARKEKKKEKGALSAEGKVDRDYQRLKAYTEKKNGK